MLWEKDCFRIEMFASTISILVYGQDSALLETRRLVLQHDGFDLSVALELKTVKEALAKRTFYLFILCHSLSSQNCEGALALTRSKHSGMKNLILSTALSGCTGDAEDVTLSAFADPRTLIRTVSHLCSQQPSNA